MRLVLFLINQIQDVLSVLIIALWSVMPIRKYASIAIKYSTYETTNVLKETSQIVFSMTRMELHCKHHVENAKMDFSLALLIISVTKESSRAVWSIQLISQKGVPNVIVICTYYHFQETIATPLELLLFAPRSLLIIKSHVTSVHYPIRRYLNLLQLTNRRISEVFACQFHPDQTASNTTTTITFKLAPSIALNVV